MRNILIYLLIEYLKIIIKKIKNLVHKLMIKTYIYNIRRLNKYLSEKFK